MISVTKKTKILTNNVLSGRFGKYSFVKNIQKVSKSKDFPVLSFYRSKILVGQNKNNLVVSEKFWTGRNILNSTKNDFSSKTFVFNSKRSLNTIEINSLPSKQQFCLRYPNFSQTVEKSWLYIINLNIS